MFLPFILFLSVPVSFDDFILPEWQDNQSEKKFSFSSNFF